MADKLGISPQLLGQYESEKRHPKTQFYLKFKEVFGINLMETNVSERFDSAKQKYIEQGYSPSLPAINTDQGNTLLLAINSATYANTELLCEVLAAVTKVPIEEVRAKANRLTHEKMRLVEQVLDKLIEVPSVGEDRKGK